MILILNQLFKILDINSLYNLNLTCKKYHHFVKPLLNNYRYVNICQYIFHFKKYQINYRYVDNLSKDYNE